MATGDGADTARRALAYPEHYIDRYRGLLLGMMLGDLRTPSAPHRSGALTQVLCFTVDAMIRAELRARADGRAAHPIDEVRAGLLRWGGTLGQVSVPDLMTGWVANVPALAADRGELPATAWALPGLAEGLHLAANDARSSDAMLRSLPLAAAAGFVCPTTLTSWAQGAAGLTHGHPEAWSAAAFLTILVGAHLVTVGQQSGSCAVDPTPALRWLRTAAPDDPLLARVEAVIDDEEPFTPARLAEHSPDDTAASVLTGGLYVRARAGDVSRARELARAARDPAAVAALACGLVGLELGPAALDVAELADHELTWVVDCLARDHATVLWSPPAAGSDDLVALGSRYPWSVDDPRWPTARC
ncbi:hypothetical protein [Mariniluteicoccus flavus]